MTPVPEISGGDAARLFLAGIGTQRMPVVTLAAAVLEENPHLSIGQIYTGVWEEVRAGRAEIRTDTSEGITYVLRRTPKDGDDATDWTIANDLPLHYLIERLAERVDEALVQAGAGKHATRVQDLLRAGLVHDVSYALAAERGSAVQEYVRVTGVHPSQVARRRTGEARMDPRRTNPAHPRRFDR